MKKTKHLSNNNSAYNNKSLTNLQGERWKEIPEGEGYYLISNFGRVKSLPRFIEVYIPSQKRSITYYTKERILSIKVHAKWNSIVKKIGYDCTVSLRVDGNEKTFMVARLVYHSFVKNLNFEKDKLMIMHKDSDGLNNHYKNLSAGTRSIVTQKAYKQKRHISPFSIMSKSKKKEIYKRVAASNQKPVIQLTLSGKKIQQYDSIRKASDETGIADSNINKVLKGNGRTAGGYVWQYVGKK